MGALYKIDCFKLLSRIKDNSIDCIFLDPPFNLNKKYENGSSDNLSKGKYLSWSYRWIDEAIRVLKSGGSLFIYNIPKWLYLFSSYLDDKMLFRHWIAITMKNNYPRGNKLYPAHYGLIYFTKGEPKTFNKLRIPISICRHCKKELKDYGGHRNKLNPLGLNLSDFWEDTSPVRHNKFKYRAANELKPIIPERAILMSTNKNDIVLDFFSGGGSTLLEAEKHKRFWIGCDIASTSPIKNKFKSTLHSIEMDTIPKKINNVFKSKQ